MNRVCSIFSQIMQVMPRVEFEQLVRKHQAERHARGFSCWSQFIAMVFCQLGRAHSLREICGGLAASEGKLQHLGLEGGPSRTTLAYANQHRPWELYQAVFGVLRGRLETSARHPFRFRNKLLSLDSSCVGLCVSMFDWAQFQRKKGAVKLHLLLDHDGYLPHYAVVTTGKQHEISVARTLRFEPGTVLVFDKGYCQYRWWNQLTRQGVFFVTRLRRQSRIRVLLSRPVPPTQTERVRADEDIELLSWRLQYAEPVPGLRRIVYWDPDQEREFVFVTNHPRLAAATIAEIYRHRWQIETFFKSLKQLLKIRTFVGTSLNAVYTQIWTALIVMLILRWLRAQAAYSWSLSNLVALLRHQLFVHRELWAWLNRPFEPPPDYPPLPQQLAFAL